VSDGYISVELRRAVNVRARGFYEYFVGGDATMPERDKDRTPSQDRERTPHERFEDAITKALKKKKPAAGWPGRPERGRNDGGGGGGAGSGGN
jgi:hypothetical protein